MIYKKGRRKKGTSPVKITREDIEKAMLEFKGEIQYLKVEKDSFNKNNPIIFRRRKPTDLNPPNPETIPTI